MSTRSLLFDSFEYIIFKYITFLLICQSVVCTRPC
uniref:Uncharacterized protein n=1 Tax=Arundo donax TaxID=35708 RepID=A0A0A9AZI7_ARUDO